MPHYVVLLRGVNVGPNNRVPMVEFRAALESLGGRDVRTVLNSGNAVFSSTARSADRLAEQVAEVVRSRFGVTTPVIVKSAATFIDIVRGNPFPPADEDASRFLVAFAGDAATLATLHDIAPLVRAEERFAITSHAAYLHCTGGLLASAAGEALLGRRAQPITTRNWATVRKIAALLPSDP
jgi:uncharacterized protein (DUF1697 family)